MTFKNPLYYSLLLLFIIGCNTEKAQKYKTTGNLELSKANPQPGDDLEIRYKAEDPNFTNDDFAALFYVLVDDNIYAEDLNMKDNEEAKEADIHIPDSATTIAFNFKNDDNYDTNNNLGYVFELYDSDKPTPGALAAKSNFHLQMDGRMRIEDPQTDSIVHWLKTDIEQHPELEGDWQEIYAQTLLRNDRTKGEEYIKERLAAIKEKEERSEEDYNALIFIYDQLQEEGEKDSIQKEAAKKYPKGKLAQRTFFDEFAKLESDEDKKKVFKHYQDSIGEAGQYKDMMLTDLMEMALNKGDLDEIENYLVQLYDKEQRAQGYNVLALVLLHNNMNLDDAVRFSKKAIDGFSRKELDKPDFLTESEFKDKIYAERLLLRDTYAKALYEKGELSKSLEEQEKAVGEGSFPELNEHYIQYMVENKDYKEAEDKAAEFIALGNTTEDLKSYFKEAYTEHHGSDDGYDKELAALEEKAFEKTKEELESEMIDKEVPDLHLTDPDGNTVELADLKGKTVILDFWATWCGPCIQSFPGMERAMNHFEDNEDVQFYYVNTFQQEEEEERHDKVKDFMETNDYPFEVLYDKNEDKSFLTASNFGITGIPTKIIIGPNGKWNFTKVGYSGNNDKLLDEIKVIVELTQS